jgi:hypothetical protein
MNIKPTRMQEFPNGYSAQNNGGGSNSHGGQMTLEQIDPTSVNRTSAIESIENALHDISGLFKRFGTVVAQHE